jgi:hypothetical protein
MKTKQALEYKNKGNNSFQEGDYEKALQFYGKAVEVTLTTGMPGIIFI